MTDVPVHKPTLTKNLLTISKTLTLHGASRWWYDFTETANCTLDFVTPFENSVIILLNIVIIVIWFFIRRRCDHLLQ